MNWSVRCLALLLVVAAVCTATSVAQDTSWSSGLAAWRTEHTADLQKPDGWLALAGLEWLRAGDNSFGSAADNQIRLPAGSPPHVGVLRLNNAKVTLDAPG